MSLSLREQLLQAGLVGSKQVKQAEQQQRQHAKHKPQGPTPQQLAAQQAHAAKVARDKELNLQRQQDRERQARLAQIRQLVDQHRLPRIESDDYFNFMHRKKIHRIAVDAALRERLTKGEVIIVRYGKFYAPVPPEIAAQVRERDADSVVDLNAPPTVGNESGEDDPYKDFAVPDDLRW
jgi:uncharacterized protein